jgi:hypothetical protein
MAEQLLTNWQQAIINLRNYLQENSNGCYHVVGNTKQSNNSVSVEKMPLIQVFHAGGNFPKNKSSMNSETAYNAIAAVRITTAAKASVDLDVLQNPSSTPEEITAAIAGMGSAEFEANELCDTIFAITFNLIMGSGGERFGDDTKPYNISDRWGDDFKKESVLPGGSIAVINGYYHISFTSFDIPTGKNPTTPESIFGRVFIQDQNSEQQDTIDVENQLS